MRLGRHAATLLAGDAAGSGGRASVAVAARARHGLAVAGRACLDVGDRGRRPRPAGMAALKAGPAAGERRGAPRAGRHGRAVARLERRRTGRMGRGARDRRRDRAVFLHRDRTARRQRPRDGRSGRTPLPSRGAQRLGAIQPARGLAAGRAAVSGRAPGGAPPHPGSQDDAAQSSAVGAAANERYGAAAQKGWRVGYGLWRLVRAVLNPLQAVGQETSGVFVEKTAASFPIVCAPTRRGCSCSRSAALPSTSIPADLRSRTTRCAPRGSVTWPTPRRRSRRCGSS